MSAEAPTPIAEGTLSGTPLAHVLLYALTNQLGGTLAIWPVAIEGQEPPRGQDRIRFKDGQPVAARLREPASTLELGLLPLLSRTDGPYAFYEADLVGDGPTVQRASFHVHALLAAWLRGGSREDAVDAVLGRFGDLRLRLRDGVDLSRFDLNAREQGFVQHMRASMSNASTLTQEFGDPKVARRLLYLFAITKCVESAGRASIPSPRASTSGPPNARSSQSPLQGRVTTPPQAPTPTPPPGARATNAGRTSGRSSTPEGRARGSIPATPAVPAGLAPELQARWREIAERAPKIDDENYFEMLGVDKNAASGAIRDAYFALAKRWHPDRLPPELEVLKPWADRIFHHYTQAHETLSDETMRAKYLRMVQDGGGTPAADRKLTAIINAAMAFQKVEVLVRRRDFTEGSRLLDEAIALNPEEADYYAMRALIDLQSQSTPDFPRILANADKALAMDDKRERSHFVRATVLKRMGRESEALAHFRRALDINPKNLDAQREVRLANMRTSTPPSADSSSDGLLSKLFGKKK